MATAIGYGGMRLFANGYVSLFIIPYGGKAGSGLNPLRGLREDRHMEM